MRIALVLTPMSDHHLRLASQVGVTDIVTRYPGEEPGALLRLKERIEGFGMRLSVLEGRVPHDEIVFGRSGSRGQIENFKRLLREMGKAGIGVCCYNWMPSSEWVRTATAVPERGGALVTAFDAEADPFQPPAPTEAATEELLWRTLTTFLREIAPVAEENGIKLAMHPDDPPLARFRGHSQIMWNVAAFERLFEIVPRSVNGMCFCQGTFAETGVDIPKTIRRLGGRINYVHFRDVRGTVPKFHETFHDNGQTDMVAAMREYRAAGFDGPMRPDHVPTLDGESNDHPGYAMLGRLFAVGYIRGLIQAVNHPSAARPAGSA